MEDKPRIEDTVDEAIRRSQNKREVKCLKCQGMGGIMWRDGEEKHWEDCDQCNGTGVINKVTADKLIDNCKEIDQIDNAILKVIVTRAINLWGEPAQINMAIEECAELIVKLVKLGRFKNGSEINEVVSEIAYVEIMMAQLRLIFGSDAVDEEKARKLKRLLSRIQDSEQKQGNNDS
ncbi:MAG: hypothetical protein EHM34_00305 [Nitrosopumilales archaeon]|nr:MAG: hypothetical protein EHM34_00305 [Nitrosopumilales archaeon]